MRVVVEHSPVGESRSNGVVERAIKGIQVQMRKLKLKLKEQTGMDIDSKDPLRRWMVEYAARILRNHYVYKGDEQTARQRIRYNTQGPQLCDFGEYVFTNQQ